MAWDSAPVAAAKDEPRKSRPVSELFTPAVDLESSDSLKVALYGRAKVGKSHFAYSAAQDEKVYIIDTENSAKTLLKRFPPSLQQNINVINVMMTAGKTDKKVDLIASLNAMYEAIDSLTDMILEQQESNKESGCIILDSATDLWDWLQIWLEERANVKRTASGDMPRFEYGKANKKYTEFIQMLLRSDWDVILTFRAKEAMTSKGESLGYDNPRWQKNTDYWVDLIAELKRDGTDHIMSFVGGRYGDWIDDITNPTWRKLKAHINSQAGITFDD